MVIASNEHSCEWPAWRAKQRIPFGWRSRCFWAHVERFLASAYFARRGCSTWFRRHRGRCYRVIQTWFLLDIESWWSAGRSCLGRFDRWLESLVRPSMERSCIGRSYRAWGLDPPGIAFHSAQPGARQTSIWVLLDRVETSQISNQPCCTSSSPDSCLQSLAILSLKKWFRT